MEKHTSTEVISVTKELASKGKIEDKNKNVLKRHDDDICYQSNSIVDIFSNYMNTQGRSLILIEGAPGIGKTVLSKEIVYQWANNTLLNHKRFVFLLYLRDPKLKNIGTLEDLVTYVFKVTAVKSLAAHLFKTKGADITIILDGYDEMSEEQRQSSFIADIINRTVLAECGLVITSRPTASVRLHNKADCRVEILGFTESNRLNYIEHALQGKDDKIEEVKLYLQSHSTINALCYIPLNMTILLSLFYEQTPSQAKASSLPDTQTEMYEKFIKVTITRFLQRVSKEDIAYASEFSVLPEPHNNVFNELAKLAYDALVKDQIIFTRDEILKECPHLTMKSDNWNGLGLIKAAHYDNNSVSFHFLHFSIQEYMAAYYISLLTNNKQIRLLNRTFWKIHYFNTWIMYVGITHGESFAWKHYLSGNFFKLHTRLLKPSDISKKFLHNKIKCLHLFQCIIEGSSESIEQLEKSLFQDRIIDLSNQTLQPKYINILGFFLLRSINKQWKKINLSGCNLRDVGCNALCNIFMDKSNREMLKVDEVDFSYNQLQLDAIKALLDVFNYWNTMNAIICSNNNPFYTCVKELEFFELIMKFDINGKKLQTISIGQSLFGNKATQNSLSSHFFKSINFTGLYLNECAWEDNSPLNKEFIALIKEQKLSKIHIIGKTNSYCIKAIAEAVEQTDSVFIYDRTLSNMEVDKIASVLLSKGDNPNVVLVIGQYKIKGKLHTDSLSTRLSSSECYYLILAIMHLCQPLVNYFKPQQSCWDKKYFYDLFILLQNNSMQCQLSICLVEDSTLVAYKCKCEDISEILCNYPSLNYVYISHCYFCNNTISYNLIDLISEQKLLLNCYILNISWEADLIEYVCSKLISKRMEKITEKFILILHSVPPSYEINFNVFNCNCYENDSVILLTKDTILGYHITNQFPLLLRQLTLPFRTWKFWYCELDLNILDLINTMEPDRTNCLIELDFSHCSVVINDKCHFLKNTQSFTCLKKFDISGFKALNNLIEEMTCFLLQNTQLEELDISNLDLDVKNCRALVGSLKKHLNLTKLNISNIGYVTDEDVAAILSHNVKIEELDLSNLKANDFSTIANSMRKFMHLKKLNISSNKITANTIADILSHNTKLENINLSNLFLCSNDFMIIALKMKSVSNLKSLDISGNYAHTNYYAPSKRTLSTTNYPNSNNIAVLLSHNTKLEELDMSNLDLSSEDFINIATALNSVSKLSKLKIFNNKIDGSVTDAIITLLNHNVDLKMLDISDIMLTGIHVIKVAEALQKRSKLTKINIWCGVLTNNEADAIAAILSHNSNLREIKLKSGNHVIEVSENLSRLVTNAKWIQLSKQEAYTLAALLSNCTELEILNMASNDMKVEDAIRVFKSMKNISTLKTIDISCCDISDLAANSIAEVFANNKQLKKIDISWSNVRPLGSIKIFGGMKNLLNLIKLNVSSNRIADKEAYEDTESFTEKLVPIVSRISHLTTKSITHKAVQCLASVIDHNLNLQELDMGDLELDPEQAVLIFKSMKNITKLTKLDISGSSLTNNAAKLLASILSHNISLQMLYLRSCSLQTEGAKELFNAIRNHSCLICLNIIKNYNVGDQSVIQCLASILENKSNLQYLHIGGLYLHSKEIIFILKSIKNLINLVELDISYNDINNEAADILASVLLRNINLQSLVLTDCSLQIEGALKILNAIRYHQCLTFLDLRENDIGELVADRLRAVLWSNSKLGCHVTQKLKLWNS